MRFFLLIPLSIPFLNVIWWAWGHYQLGVLKHARRWQTALALFVAGQLILFGMLLSSRRMGHSLLPPASLVSLAYIWHLVVLPLFMMGLGAWYGLRLLWLFGKFAVSRWFRKRKAEPLAATTGEMVLSRRELLKVGVVSAPAALAILGTLRAVPSLDHFRIRRIEVPLADLPSELDGLTIAHITDVHAGKFTDEAVLQQIVRRTNDLTPDLILLTGDLIDYSLRDLPNALDAVKQLNPRKGLFLCEGNHDLFESRSGFENQVRAAGVPLLINEQETLSIRGVPLQIAGLRWERPGNDPHKTFSESIDAIDGLSTQRDGPFRIMLAHHPHSFDTAAARGIPLTLAGHTHGGQLMLSDEVGAGPMLFKYWSGLYRQGNSALVVGNGAGNWFPLRLNAPAEVIHITLRSNRGQLTV